MVLIDSDYAKIYEEWQNIPSLRDKYAFMKWEQAKILKDRIVEKYYSQDGKILRSPRFILREIDVGRYTIDDDMQSVFEPLYIPSEEMIIAVSFWGKNAISMQFQTFARHFWEIYHPGIELGVVNKSMSFLLYVDHEEVVHYCELPVAKKELI